MAELINLSTLAKAELDEAAITESDMTESVVGDEWMDCALRYKPELSYRERDDSPKRNSSPLTPAEPDLRPDPSPLLAPPSSRSLYRHRHWLTSLAPCCNLEVLHHLLLQSDQVVSVPFCSFVEGGGREVSASDLRHSSARPS